MKKIKTMLLLAATILGAMSFQSCGPDDPPIEQTESNFTMQFDHVFGMSLEEFFLNKEYKHPNTGDTLTFTKLKYYISNIQLQKTDGSWYAVPESYHLIDLGSESSFAFDIGDVPIGEYKAIKFLHGIDSTRNVSGAQDGALAISNNMFWGWNSGYIMMKVEGFSPQATNGNFAYHLGGFTGEYNVVTQKSAEFSSGNLLIEAGKKPIVHIAVNPAKLWHTAGSMTGIPNSAHSPGELTTTMANDIFGWTNFTKIVNPQ